MCQVSQQPSRPVPTPQRLTARPKQGKPTRMTVVCWESCPGSCVVRLLCRTSVCSTAFKYWQKLEKGEKKEPSHKSTFSLCSQDHYLLNRQKFNFFSPWVPSEFFSWTWWERGLYFVQWWFLSAQEIPSGSDTLLRTASGLLTGDLSVCVCVCVCLRECVCVPFRTRDPYMHCWFCRTELFLKR